MRRLTWIPPTGDPLSLALGGSIYALSGVQTAGMPSVRTSEIIVPMQPGSRWQRVDHGPRDIVVPVDLSPDPEAAMDTLVALIDPTVGDGRLRMTRSDSTERELFCRYIDGLVPVEQTDRLDGWLAALIFRAVDPYWYDRNPRTLSFSPGGAGQDFFPFFPLVLGASEIASDASVVNDGHVATWPVWTITGPGTVTATNQTTGETWELGHAIGEGETVTVDTRPGVKTVVSSTAGDLFAELSDVSSLWPLVTGSNEIAVEMASATPTSRLLLTWWRRWLTA